MAIALVNHTEVDAASSNTGTTVTLGFTPSVGDTLVVWMVTTRASQSGTGISGCGATWTALQTFATAARFYTLWVGTGCTGTGNTLTVSWAIGSAASAYMVSSWSGVGSVETSASSSNASSNTPATPAVTPGSSGDVAVGGWSVFDGGSAATFSSYSDAPSAWTTVRDAYHSSNTAQTGHVRYVATSGSSTSESATGSEAAGEWGSFAVVLATNVTVALTADVTAEQVLAGALSLTGAVALTGSTKQEHTLSATLTVSGAVSLHGTISRENLLGATLTVTQPLASWATDDAERTDLPLELSGLLSIEPVEDPPPAADPFIQRVSITMPTPTLTNGAPVQPWTPTVARSDWGRLQLIIDGVDRSRPRGIAFQPLQDAHTDPFGDAEATFAFPALTEFDNPATWGLTALAPVTLRRKDPGGVFHTLYEGAIASLEPDDGQGVVIQCVGALYRLDLLREPPRLLTQSQDYGDLIAAALNDKRRRYYTNTGYCRHVITGVPGVRNADFQPLLTGTIQDYLAELQTQGSAVTLMLARPRTPQLAVRDTTTVHATVSHGAPGVALQLSKDYTAAITAVYGSGSNGHCAWMGARFPNLHQESTPTFPLAVGAVFNAGSATTGFAPFAAFLRSGQYGTIESDDTYLASDFDSVEQFQDRAGITVDGIVGAQTWEAAFQPGANQGSLYGAYVDTIYEKAETRRRLYNAQGADVGPNPSFDPSVPRIEDYIPFGDNVSKKLGRTSAKQIIARSYPAGRVGTIILTSDPAEMSRYDLAAGMNIKVDNYNGSSVLLHITRRQRDWQAESVTLTVDEKARDLLTAASVHQRNKDVSDLTRRQRFGRQRSKVFNDYGVWLCEDGAGHIPLMNQQGGFWNVQRIAAAPKGTIERISLALGSGLTQHLVNQTVSDTPPPTIPGAARGAVAMFTQPVTASALGNLSGLSTPTTDLADGTNPWDVHDAVLRDSYGMIYAAGGPGAQIGFYPNNDPGDGSTTNLSGIFEDGGSIDFGPTGHYWLWVAVWTSTSCKVGGRVFPGAPS